MRTLHIFRALALVGIASLIVKLFATGQMVLYMSPALDPLTALTAVLVACMGLLEFRAAVRHRPNGREHAGSRVDQALTLGIVLLPVSLGLLVTPRALDSAALAGADPQGLVLAYPSRPGSTTVGPLHATQESPELFEFLRQAGAAALGQQVRAIGVVARGEALAPNEFVLLRYSIVHCVADARPVGILVAGPDDAWRADEWVEIDGELDTREHDGDYLVALRATRVVPTDEPANPYLPPF